MCSAMKTKSTFETVIKEVEAAISNASAAGSQAFEARNFDKVREAADRAARLVAFRESLAPLAAEWAAVMGGAAAPAPAPAVAPAAKPAKAKAAGRPGKKKAAPAKPPKTAKQRLPRGSSAPESAYYAPILRALDQAGGKADVKDVLDKVLELVKPNLKEPDFQAFASDPSMPRWKHAAQRARVRLIKDGALKTDSPRGEWEITDAGRQRLNPA